MDIKLFVGDYAYSSWSLRGWLLLDAFGIPFTHRYAHMRTEDFEAMRAEMAPSRLVPAIRVEDGGAPFVVWDSMAMAETLAEMVPEAGLWPTDRAQRAMARALAAEMHSGFTALRGACPMNMRRAYAGFRVSEDVQADLDRLQALWTRARDMGGEGPFLFGAFTAVDAFFAPVASRIATYDLPVGPGGAAYVAAILGHASVRRWRAMGMADGHVQAHYEFDYADRPNPHDPEVTGTVVPGEAAENANCLYSGKPVHPDCVVAVGERRVGYCNPFCAAKTAADPYAWAPTAAFLEG